MSQKANYIKQRLSLREPLKEALDVLVELADRLELKKEVNLTDELDKVKALYPTCTDFEREFPSICFSIATGVGKTRLMGACIAYLYLTKGIRHFFVLAPNLTIYDKLVKDFNDPNNPKYVFQGIAEFVHNRPLVINGDNYSQVSGLFSESSIHINVFNISKFNRDAGSPKTGKEKGAVPRMKRMAEYLGTSYWEYLSKLDDLVILMDEAHRYHADASKSAINDLKPILGIELTATAIDDKGNPFRNVVYEYSLARALQDGLYVKHPTIATRQNFSKDGKTHKEVEELMLEDAISVHKATKEHLRLYAMNTGAKLVKPFILVVCRDTTHAKEVFDYVNSEHFYKGAFKDKVLQVDSKNKTEEVEALFVSLENPDNAIEIVIHVNMLKEGWDVTNLYTIVPLRASNAAVLVEQTIGRGLRLPFGGQRTGVREVDLLTVMAHDNFDNVISAAQDPNSVLNKLSFVELSESDLQEKGIAVTSKSNFQRELEEEKKAIEAIPDPVAKKKAEHGLDAKKLIIDSTSSVERLPNVRQFEDLKKPEVRKQVLYDIERTLDRHGNLFKNEVMRQAEEMYETVLDGYRKNIIEIPRMMLVPDDVTASFQDFDLDTTNGFDQTVLNEEIMRHSLMDNKVDFIAVQHGAFSRDTPVNQVVSAIIDYPEVDYDRNSELLHKLAKQALDALSRNVGSAGDLRTLVRQFRRPIAANIYGQMMKHFSVSAPKYTAPKVMPFVAIEDWNFTQSEQYGVEDFRVKVPLAHVPRYVFRGFEKACHREYKFESGTEKDFAIVLENDRTVEKWLRPAQRQFRIYWDKTSRQYMPDFVVETADAIYLVETKKAKEVDSAEVQDKKRAAKEYCRNASDYNAENGGKPWHYLLIPHDEVRSNSTFEFFVSRYKE